MKRLVDDIFIDLNPLIEKGILKLEKEENVWQVRRIEGSFDFQETKEIISNSLSIIRNHIYEFRKYNYFFWVTYPLRKRKVFEELEEEIFLLDKVIQALLKALSLQEKVGEFTVMRMYSEMQFLLESRRIVTDSVHNLQQSVNEKHILLTIVIAALALLVAISQFVS